MSAAPGYQWQPPRVPNRRGENTVLVLLVVAALIPALWFGLQPSQRTRLPERPVGVPFDAFPLRLTFTGAVAVDEDRELLAFPKEGSRYLVVRVNATVTGERFVYFREAAYMMVLSAPGLLNIGQPAGGRAVAPDVIREHSGLPGGVLQPGVETSLVLVWEQSTSSPVPPTVTIQISTSEWAESPLQDGYAWFTDVEIAQTTIPVGQG